MAKDTISRAFLSASSWAWLTNLCVSMVNSSLTLFSVASSNTRFASSKVRPLIFWSCSSCFFFIFRFLQGPGDSCFYRVDLLGNLNVAHEVAYDNADCYPDYCKY